MSNFYTVTLPTTAASASPFRSKLFVPGSRPELFDKAAATRADALSFDLEDAVINEKKEAARAATVLFLRRLPAARRQIIIVRVNRITSGYFRPDIEAIVGPGLDIINIPKVESASDIQAAEEFIGNAEIKAGIEMPIKLLATIESPKGLRLAAEIANASPRLIGLQIGFNDFCAACGIDRQETLVLNSVRLAVRYAAAEAGIAAYDTPFIDVTQPVQFRAEAEDARRFGFTGKSCIHPAQVPIANEVFAPRDDQIAFARKILRAAEEAAAKGRGAFLLDGQMIDNPVISQARSIVALTERVRNAPAE